MHGRREVIHSQSRPVLSREPSRVPQGRGAGGNLKKGLNRPYHPRPPQYTVHTAACATPACFTPSPFADLDQHPVRCRSSLQHRSNLPTGQVGFPSVLHCRPGRDPASLSRSGAPTASAKQTTEVGLRIGLGLCKQSYNAWTTEHLLHPLAASPRRPQGPARPAVLCGAAHLQVEAPSDTKTKAQVRRHPCLIGRAVYSPPESLNHLHGDTHWLGLPNCSLFCLTSPGRACSGAAKCLARLLA